MEYQELFKRITDEFSPRILSWAVKKTGNRADGEDLAQEVLLQIFIAAAREKRVDKLENFIWKVAHYVWCNNLRHLTKSHKHMALSDALRDEEDFSNNLIHKEEVAFELNRMRRKIAHLSYIQREAVILHYLDGLSLAEVSKRLDTSLSTIKWHLFDARKKMREEHEYVKENNSYIYRPGRLAIGLSGTPGPNPDTQKVNENLVRQNILLLCYRESKSIDELTEMTGIPKPYLEYDLEWLKNCEFLALEGKRYRTSIPILGKKHRQEIGELYCKTREEYIDRVLSFLLGHEQEIRRIGFYGSNFDTEKLMWPITMMFLSYFSRNSEIAGRLKKMDDRAVRPDGGRYYAVGNDLSDSQELNSNGYFNPESWGDFYGICSDSCFTEDEYESYYWLGVYNFVGSKYHPEVVKEKNKAVRAAWHKLFCSLVDKDFSVDKLSSEEKEKLATAFRDGWVIKDNNQYRPNFIILSKAQLNELQEKVFLPLLREITPKTEELAKIISDMHHRNIPRITKGCVDYFTYLDLWYFGIYALTFAAQDGKLYIPATPEEGAPLTLVLIS